MHACARALILRRGAVLPSRSQNFVVLVEIRRLVRILWTGMEMDKVLAWLLTELRSI